MSIKANLGGNVKPVSILITDTILFSLPAGIDRYHIGACNLFNTDAVNTATIEVYISPDTTSAAGKLVDTLLLASLEDIDINSIVGQGHTENIILKSNIVGTNASITVTLYDAGS